MKYYCIFAINKTNPDDILGMTEGFVDMPWSKERVCLWEPPEKDNKYCFIKHRDYFNSHTRDNKFQYGFNWCEWVNVKGKKQVYRKLISNPEYRYYHSCGRSSSEYMWHWVKHFAKRHPIPGYDIIICRVNSKYCPVKVDVSEREDMNKGHVTFDKYKYRNAKFYHIKDA